MVYTCHLCNKEYHRERCFKSHVAVCEFTHRSKRERDEEIQNIDELPSKKDLFLQIVFLTKELERVKSDLEIVKRTQGVKKNKISIISWLNDNYKPDLTISEMINKLDITKTDFELMLEENTKITYVNIIKRFITENMDKKLPICAFPQSVDNIYVYMNYDDIMIKKTNKEKKMVWTNISEVFIQSIISKIEKTMLNHFREWEKEMGDKIYEDEDTSEKYSSYVTAIIGKSNKDIVSEISRFMKPRLYQILKRKDVNMSITEIA